MYAFKPEGGKWQLYMFDLDWLMLAAPLHMSIYAASTAPLFNSEDPNLVMAYLYKHTALQENFADNLTCLVPGPDTGDEELPLVQPRDVGRLAVAQRLQAEEFAVEGARLWNVAALKRAVRHAEEQVVGRPCGGVRRAHITSPASKSWVRLEWGRYCSSHQLLSRSAK